MNFTNIEQSILDWYSKRSENDQFVLALKQASAGSREQHESGFFTDILLPDGLKLTGQQQALTGCGLFSDALDNYADCIIHTIDGIPDHIEVIIIGDGNLSSINEFTLKFLPSTYVDLR